MAFAKHPMPLLSLSAHLPLLPLLPLFPFASRANLSGLVGSSSKTNRRLSIHFAFKSKFTLNIEHWIKRAKRPLNLRLLLQQTLIKLLQLHSQMQLPLQILEWSHCHRNCNWNGKCNCNDEHNSNLVKLSLVSFMLLLVSHLESASKAKNKSHFQPKQLPSKPFNCATGRQWNINNNIKKLAYDTTKSLKLCVSLAHLSSLKTNSNWSASNQIASCRPTTTTTTST